MIERLGKYRIDSVLGKGAMGVVYKAYDPLIARTVALKTIRKELFSEGQQAELIGRFKNEAQAAGRLNHANIVTVYDYGEDNESAYIAMEFVDGAGLDTLMKQARPTPLAHMTAWMGDLLLALEYAHSRGVVHRDIKPANLLLAGSAHVKVGDFGIARMESSTLTQTGSMVGTPSYMSPEQFRGDPVDGRADVFSAGIVLYQMLTGVRPFVGSATVVMQQILNDEPTPPSALLPALGRGFDDVVARAMAKSPSARFPSARAFLDALMAAARSGGGADPDATTLGSGARTVATGGVSSSGAVVTNGADTLTPWKVESFPELESVLSRQIGPMARLLLRKAGSKADSMDELCELLLQHIPSQHGRSQFWEAVELLKKKLAANGTGCGNAASGSRSRPPTAIASTATQSAIRPAEPVDDAYAERVALRLTRFIGPIARVVARRAARQTGDRAEFLQLLAVQIESTAERSHFLAEAGAD
ncbi:serine/threonine protein kinase [Massilia eurypsychrophila]|uniref:non-specific serine/threonine protein kinase n=1 Tax=Massilia eurypsychrophila TaxID=1485217 RepID=A0A2G8TGC8_9BURK|nr:serine/threonine-protein kinase [Massilia eurypsychrophila]PIL44999.1 serine/threonine protein kinase [Massilia eurypsychrophila]